MGKEGKKVDAGRNLSFSLPVIMLALAAVMTFLVYLPARTMSFYFDDKVTILHNEKIQSDNWMEVFSENPFRALTNLSFSIQYKMHGPAEGQWPKKLENVIQNMSSEVTSVNGESARLRGFLNTGDGKTILPVSIDRERGLVFPLPPARPFRVLNLLIHLMNSALLYLVVRRIGIDYKFAVWASVMFMVHPLCSEPINYITARFSLMALTFSLLAIFAHIRADDNPRNDVLAFIYFILALLCKESAVVLPVIMFLLDTARGNTRYRTLYSLILSFLYIIFRSKWLVVLTARQDELLNSLDYFMVQQKIFWLYILKIFYPVHLNFDYHIIPSFHLDLFITIINIILFLVASSLIVFKMNSDFRKKKTNEKEEGLKHSTIYWVCTVFLMCIIVLLPTSSFIPLGDLVKEDRAYPVLAVLIPAVFAGLLPKLLNDRKKVITFSTAIVIIFFFGMTFSRNMDWRSSLDLDKDNYTKSPQKPRAAYNYAQSLKWTNQLEKSLFYFQKVLEMEPDNRNAIINVRALQSRLSKEKG
jgi:hypothetical protein